MTHADDEAQLAREKLRRGLADPDGFFRNRGIELAAVEGDGQWWAGWERAPRYGSGSTPGEAKLGAVRRWMSEQEHPDLRRRQENRCPNGNYALGSYFGFA